MKLIRQADIYAPEHLGIKDILIEGNRIAKISDHLDEYAALSDIEIIEADGKILVPGYIDLHEHITGGGGEGGPSTRVPEAPLSCLVESGVTTAVGLLGTDGITRSIENLLAKARSFEEAGITCRILTGSYGYPAVTLTGSVERDILLIDLVVGVKTAASDHRSSNITSQELIRLATDARRGGMLGGKPGYVTVHMGSGKAALEPLFEAVENSDLPMQIIQPTHMGRTEQLLEQGIKWIGMGGNIDITAGEDAEGNRLTADKVIRVFEHGGEDNVTVTSDGFGSMPKFNDKQELIGLTYSTPKSLHQLLKIMVREKNVPLEKALKPLTSNPAHVLVMHDRKGHISAGYDADMIIYNENMDISTVFAKGAFAVKEGKAVLKGKFEE